MIEKITVITCWCFLAICGLLLIWCIIALIKNEITFRNHKIIDDAIYHYNNNLIETEGRANFSLYDDEESYEETLKRWWDWGYKRILPPEKYELIKPYIKKGGD